MQSNAELYEQDFFAWTQTTAALIRAGKWHDIDLEALAEEIDSVGGRDRRELTNRLRVLVMHLLKWRYQPAGREEGHSWRSTILTQRTEIEGLLEQSPSLRPVVETFLQQRYPRARRDALQETGLTPAALPEVCPWTAAQILDEDFWPAAEGT